MERFINWPRKDWAGRKETITEWGAQKLVDMSDVKEHRRLTGLSKNPIKHGLEARYFSFGDFGTVKNYRGDFKRRVKMINTINKRLQWLIDRRERVPFIYGIAESAPGTDAAYTTPLTDYVFIDHLYGEQFYDFAPQNTMAGFGGRYLPTKWKDMDAGEQQKVIDYMTERVELMGSIRQEDYNQLIKSLHLLYSQELAADAFAHNIIYDREGVQKFGFYDLRSLGNDPDRGLQLLVDYLGRTSVDIYNRLKSEIPKEQRKPLEMSAREFGRKIKIADKENEKLKALVLTHDWQKKQPGTREGEKIHRIHNDAIDKLL